MAYRIVCDVFIALDFCAQSLVTVDYFNVDIFEVLLHTVAQIEHTKTPLVLWRHLFLHEIPCVRYNMLRKKVLAYSGCSQ